LATPPSWWAAPAAAWCPCRRSWSSGLDASTVRASTRTIASDAVARASKVMLLWPLRNIWAYGLQFITAVNWRRLGWRGNRRAPKATMWGYEYAKEQNLLHRLRGHDLGLP